MARFKDRFHAESTVQRVARPARPLAVFCSVAFRGALTALTPILEEHGFAFDVVYGTTAALEKRIEGGEAADVTILLDRAITAHIASGLLVGPRFDIAQSGVGLAVKAGAPKPDISTQESFVAAILAAQSITYTETGASGIHFARVLEQLGLTDRIRPKAVIRDGVVAERAASGEVELAVQQMSELVLADGVEIVGPLPNELQEYAVCSAAVFATSAQAAAANRFIELLCSRELDPILGQRGMERPRRSRKNVVAA